MSDDSLLVELAKVVGTDNVLTGEAAELFATDVYRKLESPVAALRPTSVEELQELVRFSAAKSIPFTIRGGGASYTDGYVVADSQHLLVDLGLLKQIEINQAGGFVTVEAGVTWAELAEALDKHRLRTPFRGPFSGLRATIAGSVSQNSLSHSTGKYGISAESVLSLDVILGDGSLLTTGTKIAAAAPFTRHFGPDLTGLFTGDCGAFGVKARVTLPIIRQRPAHRSLSLSFADFSAMHRAMQAIALERIEDTHFAIDAALSQGQIARQDNAGGQIGLALGILRSSPSFAVGLRQLAGALVKSRAQIAEAAYTVHYMVEGFTDAETKGKLARIRGLASEGQEIEATVPAVVRAMPFAPFYNTLGPKGERWVPVHGVLPHEKIPDFHRAFHQFRAEHAAKFEELGIWLGAMFSAIGSSGFLYEIAIYWPDEQTNYHREVIPQDYLDELPKYPANIAARAAVEQLKQDLIALYDAHDAIHFQLGRAYPYMARIDPNASGLIKAIKGFVDPHGNIGPGVLGL